MSARDVPACENVPGKVLKKPPSCRSVMLGRRGRALLLALLTISSMVSLLDRAGAQGAGLKVSSDLELLGVGGLDGGGHVTWTLTGAAAQSLRQKIQMMFDGYDPIPRGFAYNVTGGNRNGRIESGEAQSYTNFLENEVEGARPSAAAARTCGTCGSTA